MHRLQKRFGLDYKPLVSYFIEINKSSVEKSDPCGKPTFIFSLNEQRNLKPLIVFNLFKVCKFLLGSTILTQFIYESIILYVKCSLNTIENF